MQNLDSVKDIGSKRAEIAVALDHELSAKPTPPLGRLSKPTPPLGHGLVTKPTPPLSYELSSVLYSKPTPPWSSGRVSSFSSRPRQGFSLS